MKDTAEFGMNKTPTQLHPVMTQAMIDGYEEFPPHAEEMVINAFTMRRNYIENAEQLGAVPLPSTVKGAVSVGVQAIKGNSPS
ncbi:MAG: hypothetical protein ACXWTN_11080 [Methylosarcina sp.]